MYIEQDTIYGSVLKTTSFLHILGETVQPPASQQSGQNQ